MSADAAGNSGHHVPWWMKLLRSARAATGVVAVAAVPSVAPAQDAGYRSAATAPASWQAIAKELQGKFQERLGSDGAAARRLQEWLAKHEKPSPQTLLVRTWIASNGKIERLEFDGLDDATAAIDLRALLAGIVVGAPPPDMLQPLHLRLALRAGNDGRKEQ